MVMKLLRAGIFIFLLLLTGAAAHAQTIMGSVVDAQTNEPLPFVNVFISNTTKGTQTDVKGAFVLKVQSAGYAKVVASMVGYKTFEQEFVLRPDETRRLFIRLSVDTKFLNEVKISGKRDKQWKRLYKDFERAFLGRSKNARNSKVLNPYDINVTKKRQILTANAAKAIEIDNKALGYHLSYQLDDFESTADAYQFGGQLLFKLMPSANEAESQTWERNRNDTYRGSLRHFLAAVVQKKSQKEGFRVYLEETPSENLARSRYFKSNALLEINVDTLAQFNAALQRVSLPNYRYEIHYLNRRDPQNWYFDLNEEVSWLEIDGNFLAFSYNGIVENSRQLETIGSMSKRRVADLLPEDYQPTDSLSSTLFDNAGLIPNFQKQEKFLLSLNDNVYAAGDTVQFDVEVLDATTHHPVGQTLVYLTIRSENQLIEQQKLWIDQGKFSGKWVIPDSLQSDTYQLIAHNNWARNFDERFWGRKNIRVITNTPLQNPVEDSVQTTFFPESGNFISGLSNRVGFKSFTKAGNPVSIKGWVLTPTADTIAAFHSNEQGYGSFYVNPPLGQTLKAILSNGTVVAFPQAVAKGYIIQTEVLKDTAAVTIRIINNLLPAEWKPMRLLVHLRGQILYEAIVTPKRNLTVAKIPREDLEGAGVMQILLLDGLNHPIATHAFYQPAVETDDEPKAQFDPLLFESELYGGNFALTQADSNLLKNTELILLTHAIRSYSLEKPPSFEYKTGLNITGKLTQENGKPIANTTIIGFVNSDSPQLNFQGITDKSGHFSSPPLSFFGKAEVVIQVQNGVKAAIVSLDTLPSCIPQWGWIHAVPISDSAMKNATNRLIQRKNNLPLVITKSIERDFRRNYPKADITIKVDERSMKGFTFFRILDFAPKSLIIKGNGAYFAGADNLKTNEPGLALLIDGLPTTWESLKSLYGFDIEAIDILKEQSLPGTKGVMNVLLRPESVFLSDQGIKRFIITGFLGDKK